MSALLLKCEHCRWERLAMSARADAKAVREHAKTHEKRAK